MKRILILLMATVISLPQVCIADDAENLMGLGIPGPAAEYIAEDMANLQVADITTSDDVIVGDDISLSSAAAAINGTTNFTLQIGGATELTVSSNTLTIADGTALKVGNAIGWTNVDAANQACSTTCGISDCIIGTDGTNFVTCADATADSCLCDGAAS